MFKKVHVFRVKPGQEIINEISRYCKEQSLSSGIIIGIIGSVTSARLNFLVSLPGNYEGVDYKGPLEIVSAQGSIGIKEAETIIHIHIQLSGQDMCRGGHLAEATVFSTAEVTIGELDFQLRRQPDSYTDLNEIVE